MTTWIDKHWKGTLFDTITLELARSIEAPSIKQEVKHQCFIQVEIRLTVQWIPIDFFSNFGKSLKWSER